MNETTSPPLFVLLDGAGGEIAPESPYSRSRIKNTNPSIFEGHEDARRVVTPE
jgi:hypothetical protein